VVASISSALDVVDAGPTGEDVTEVLDRVSIDAQAAPLCGSEELLRSVARSVLRRSDGPTVNGVKSSASRRSTISGTSSRSPAVRGEKRRSVSF
jgi:hypothetical protein